MSLEGSSERRGSQPQEKGKNEYIRVKSRGKGRATYIPIIPGDEVRQSSEPIDAEALLAQIRGLKLPPRGNGQKED